MKNVNFDYLILGLPQLPTYCQPAFLFSFQYIFWPADFLSSPLNIVSHIFKERLNAYMAYTDSKLNDEGGKYLVV